jgi:hypothetical protein
LLSINEPQAAFHAISRAGQRSSSIAVIMESVVRSLARPVLVLSCCVAMLGCHRKQRSPAHGGPGAALEPGSGGEAQVDEIVKWDTELTEDLPGLVPAFVYRAHAYGCAIHRSDPEAAVATCDGVRIAMAKSARVVSVGCKGVTLEECQALFRRVVETKGAPAAPPPGTMPPPPPTTKPQPPPPEGGTSI